VSEDKIYVKNQSGEMVEYSLLSVFGIENRPNDYAIFTDYSKSEDNSLNIYSGILLPDKKIVPIVDEHDLEIVNNYIDYVFKN